MNFIKVLYCHLVSKHLPHVFSIKREMTSWGFWSISLLVPGEKNLEIQFKWVSWDLSIFLII